MRARRSIVATMIAACATGAAACSSSGSHATTNSNGSTRAPTSTTSPIAAYAAQYERLVAPAASALDVMQKHVKALPNDATGADAAKYTDPAADAVEAVINNLLAARWPSAVLPDIHALAVADGAVVADLRGVASQNLESVTQWENQLTADAGRGTAAATVVRADLGLSTPKS